MRQLVGRAADRADDLAAARQLLLQRVVVGLEADVLAHVEMDAILAGLGQDRLAIPFEGAGGGGSRSRGDGSGFQRLGGGRSGGQQGGGDQDGAHGTRALDVGDVHGRLQTQGQGQAEVAARLGVGVLDG